MSATAIPLSVFKECDVRGEVPNEITEDFAYKLGRAIGTVAPDRKIVVGGDFRRSTPGLLRALITGLTDSDAHVYNLGQLSTPAYYFARRKLGVLAGVMVTASHNPPGWNGFKPVLGKYPVTPEDVEQIKHRVLHEQFASGQGSIETVDIQSDYVAWLVERFSGLGGQQKMVFDCGNGATGWVIRKVMQALNLQSTLLFAEPDGTFPNRTPDISGPMDLAKLQAEVVKQGAQLGFGFDGDGDRVGLVDDQGRRVPSDQLIAWLAGQLLDRAGGGTVIYDLKLSRLVPEIVERHGGLAIAQKSGHTFIKTAMLQNDAVMGGEYSGHLFYRELDGGDDGLFSALLVASLVAESGMPLSQAFKQMPVYYSTPDIRIRYRGAKELLIQRAAKQAEQAGAKLIRVDGVKAEYPDGWALMRASVTEPAFTFRFEGNTPDAMLNVARRFLSGMDELTDAVLAQVMKQRDAGTQV